jgi:hypothetical protein
MNLHGTIDFSVRYPKDGNHTESCTLTGDPRENIPCIISVGDLSHLVGGQLIVTFDVRSPTTTPPRFTIGVYGGGPVRSRETGTNPIALTFTGYAPKGYHEIGVFLDHAGFCLPTYRSENENRNPRLPSYSLFFPYDHTPGEFYARRDIGNLALEYWHVCAYLLHPGWTDGTLALAEASFFVGHHRTFVPPH